MISGKLIAIGASIAVATAVLAGLYLSGSPREQRLLKLDDNRINGLLQLSGAIARYWEQTRQLPPDLAILVDGQRLRSLPVDPETGAMYSYEIIDTDLYRLCAEFSNTSLKTASEDFWAHEDGRQCFEVSAGPERYIPGAR